ncbi:uncharacterized protein LOC128445683 [Pleuronectes platessa]|uniref:uncharacterized protein LOC128445683 n=1 Tax=Pleuronectes platessa TaxID=8262 RepID=UPI00232A66B2|nr:uncharacterized protein LOC128445683 [Pleuronectes platessa]XP_053284438.1 uncharacterized protein LOC128445683 [Pleuronectes platessa]XP_053284439.1 uncharacterized protein LOC128445683 [Pleuronectes platessa]
MRETLQYLLLGLFLIAAVGSACVPFQCLRCNLTDLTLPGNISVQGLRNASCIQDDLYANISSKCKKDLKVSSNRNETEIDEGKAINLKCVHDLKKLVSLSGWKKDGEEISKEKNKTTFRLKKALAHKSGKYSCYVESSCGYLESEPHDLKIKNNSQILLIVCGISALVLVVTMGLVLKYKLKRDSAKHKERMEMRNQAARSGGPNPIGPRV